MSGKFDRAKGTKGLELRTNKILLRLSDSELELLQKLVDKRKKTGAALWSRSDVIVSALKFASGDIEAQVDFKENVNCIRWEHLPFATDGILGYGSTIDGKPILVHDIGGEVTYYRFSEKIN